MRLPRSLSHLSSRGLRTASSSVATQFVKADLGIRTQKSSRPDTGTLFAYTTGRWLCNDEQQRKLRYSSFNVDALEQIACRSVAAERCISWKKIGEGSFNKVFLLQFDNGRKVTIRIPCPIVRNVSQLIASEVATTSYISERWANSTLVTRPPRVIAWSASHDNPAETPYIILDYAPGVTLFSRWAHIQGDDARIALIRISQMETCLLRERFSQHGSLYFAEDVSDELRRRPLYLNTLENELQKRLAAKYRIGPIVNREWWRGEYEHVDADRGPWPDAPTMIKSAAEFQLRAIDSVDLAAPYIKTKPSDIPLLRRLLYICTRIAPLVIPRESLLSAPALIHPDLSLTNIIVDPEGPAFPTATIDWQGATVAPFFMQCRMPVAVVYDGPIPLPTDGSMPPWPDNFDELPEDQKQVVRIHHRYACRHRAYFHMTVATDPVRDRAWMLPHFATLVNLVPFITRCLADGPTELRGFLIEFQQNWASISDAPCPIDFSEEEIAAYRVEAKAQEEYRRNAEEVFLRVGCSNDGLVDIEDYERAKETIEQLREGWDPTAMKGPFPIYEGAHSTLLC